jgi:glycine cleavage system transcriptional repressor
VDRIVHRSCHPPPHVVREDVRVQELAITLVGHDRPGIVADASGILAGLGLNLTDSTMTLLRGHFAMTLICAGEAAVATVEDALAPLAAGGALVVTVREIGPELEPPTVGSHFVLSLHGADRLGIVAAVTRLLADAGGNVTDLTTRLSGELYVLVAEVDLPSTVDVNFLRGRLAAVTGELGVEAHLRPAEADVL